MEASVTLFCVLVTLILVISLYVRQKYSYWRDRGIPHDTPTFPVGNAKGFLQKRHPKEVIKEYYRKYKGTGPFVGMYIFVAPVVLVLDLDLAKDILIKDFHNFADRGLYSNERDDPLSAHLFSLDGSKWKHLRNKLSPTFTSGKMKYMFPTVMTVGERLLEILEKVVETDAVVEVRDILARFSTDVIGTCAFGIDCNSLKDPDAEFRVLGGKAFTQTRHCKLVEGFIMSFPELAKKLRMRIIHEEIHQFFMRVVRETVEYREKNTIKRNDFMNLLLELKSCEDGMTIEEIAAQVFIFFFAGFETSSTTMGFALFELALNQDVQDKLRAEVNQQFEKHGAFSYECMSDMRYMEKVLKETMRKYSVNLIVFRKSLNDYETASPGYTIPKGKVVLIPADAFHHDPEIYPDPERFDPERFSPDEMQKRHPSAWLPFGDGPRNCIGLRFGMMQMYVGLALLLKNYKFAFCEKTTNPLEMDETKPLLAPKGGIYLVMEKIQ